MTSTKVENGSIDAQDASTPGLDAPGTDSGTAPVTDTSTTPVTHPGLTPVTDTGYRAADQVEVVPLPVLRERLQTERGC